MKISVTKNGTLAVLKFRKNGKDRTKDFIQWRRRKRMVKCPDVNAVGHFV